jgi:hypothetical protein
MTTTARLDRLEREVRTWRWACLGVLSTATVAICLGAAADDDPPAVLRTGRLEVVDPDGRARAWLAASDGGIEWVLTSADGREAARLEVPAVPDKPALYFFDRAEGHQAELALTQTGPVLHFSDRQRVRLRLATNELNAPLVEVADAEGRELFAVTGQGVRP